MGMVLSGRPVICMQYVDLKKTVCAVLFPLAQCRCSKNDFRTENEHFKEIEAEAEKRRFIFSVCVCQVSR
jgi:hypothetical protein